MANWTQDDLDAINELIATGAKRIKYGDKETDLRDLDDLKATRSLIEQSLANKARKSRRFGVYCKTRW